MSRAHIRAGAPLSPREHACLALLAAGHTDRGIADALNLAVPTIQTYTKALRIKLGARTRAHAVALGITHGHIPPPDPEQP